MPLTPAQIGAFRHKVYHQAKKLNRQLPWRQTTNPYHVFVSEVMLQQTQADRVIPKYIEFLTKFPLVKTVAAVKLSQVLAAWVGLGYNRRAKYLHQAAKVMVKKHQGKVPPDAASLIKLPGIGKASAASILAFAFNQPTIFIETNIRSVFLHHFFTGQSKVSDEKLIPLITATLDPKNPRSWYNALMDYGTLLKKQYPNPSRLSRHYTKQSQFAGSLRQARGAIIKVLTAKGVLSPKTLYQIVSLERKQIHQALQNLMKEKLVKKTNSGVSLT